MKFILCGLAAALCSILCTPTVAGANERRLARTAFVEVVAVPANGPILIDGRFDEAAWSGAPLINEFVQREPAEGADPSQRTEVRLAYDDDALYVAVHAYDTDPSKVVGILTRRDQRSPSDWVKIIVDSYNDKRSAYEFAVNPVGVKTDRYYFNDGNSDDSWDAVWYVQAVRSSDGWRAEFKIPFSQLRFNNSEGGPVGFAVMREVGRLAETSTWPLLSRNANGFVSQFGEVRGLRLGKSPNKLEIVPYSVGSLDTEDVDEANPLVNSPSTGGSVGLDMKYAVRPGLTFTGTVNPDFGQVEADPAVVNLDAFETFFPERRPFFVEGSGIFRFNMDCNDGNCTGLFYSRRIGRAPQGSAESGDGEYSAQPASATIIGAGKLSGRVGKFSVGALTAATAREDAEIAAAGEIGYRQQTVEPLSAYTVLRARREYDNQSSLGFMTTLTNRQIVPDVNFLASSAVAGGVDYDWRLSRTYNISGYWAGSQVNGSAEAIGRLQQNSVHCVPAARRRLRGVRPQRHRHPRPGRLGVVRQDLRRDRSASTASPASRPRDSTATTWATCAAPTRRSSATGCSCATSRPASTCGPVTSTSTSGPGGTSAAIACFWAATSTRTGPSPTTTASAWASTPSAASLRDRATRGGPAVLGNPSRSIWFYANTDNRKALSFSYSGFHWTDEFGSSRNEFRPGVNLRPTQALSVNASFRYFVNHDDAQWVTNETDAAGMTHYVFGRIDQTTAAITFRFNYTLTPNLSLQVYAEPFVSVGNYENFKKLADGRNPEYAARYTPYAYSGDPDFNYRSFRTTNVLRWEFKPGSALFLVWQQGREENAPYDDYRFTRDFGGAVRGPGAQRVPGEVHVLAQYVDVNHEDTKSTRAFGCVHSMPSCPSCSSWLHSFLPASAMIPPRSSARTSRTSCTAPPHGHGPLAARQPDGGPDSRALAPAH